MSHLNWNYYLIFAIIVIFLDILLCFYKNNFKPLNYFLVFVMAFGHPLYFYITLFAKVILMFIVVLIIPSSILQSHYAMFVFTLISYIILLIFFAFLRYKFHKSRLDYDLNLYDFSKFYFFTIMFIPIYVDLFYDIYYRGHDENFWIISMYFVPFLAGFAILYSIIKISIINYIKRKKNI